MQKICSYQIVSAPIKNGLLEKSVNGLIRDGWQPIGGVHRTARHDIGTQALVQYGIIDELAEFLRSKGGPGRPRHLPKDRDSGV